MYRPTHFREDTLEVQHELIRSFPLGLLVTAGPGGLVANPLPFLIDASASEKGSLLTHLAKANEQWKDLEPGGECLVVFSASEDYVSPSWYPTKKEHGRVVPTWNYATVHAWGRPRVISDPAWLRGQLDGITALMEGGRPEPWQVDDAPPAFVEGQIRGIIGVEIVITRIEGKWKVSQNRAEVDRRGVVEGLTGQGPRSLPMARLVAERGGLAVPVDAPQRTDSE